MVSDLQANAAALADLEATGQEFIITNVVGDPGQYAYLVEIVDDRGRVFRSNKYKPLAEAACRAIVAWHNSRKEASHG